MQDDPPEDDTDEFDGVLDDAPSTGPHMPEKKGRQQKNAAILLSQAGGVSPCNPTPS